MRNETGKTDGMINGRDKMTLGEFVTLQRGHDLPEHR
jgi:hypothetical protein